MTSSTTPTAAPGAPHPAVAVALRVAEEIEEVLSLDPAFMPTGDKQAALLAWAKVATLVEAERLRLLAVSADVADGHGSRDVDQARTFGPRELRVLGRRVLDVVAPEVGQQAELRALAAEEAGARNLARLTSERVGDGTTIVRIRTSEAAADRLTTYLHAYTSPRHTRAVPAGAGPDAAPYAVRMGRAFEAFLEDVDPRRLPLHGGNATSVVVLVGETALREGVGVATTTTGQSLSIGQVRRLACSADILPAVLGATSEVLDMGRTRRLFARPQRVALAIRDRGCRAEGCDLPAGMCEAHHLDPWGRGGRTDLTSGILLCSFHHHRIHDSGYRSTITAQRRVELTRINRRT